MSGSRQAAVVGGSHGDGGRSSILGWEAEAGSPRGGPVTRAAHRAGDDHLRALVSEGDPWLELAAQVKDSHATFRAMVMVHVGARLGSIIK